MPTLIPCASCGEHVLGSSCVCVHCGAKLRECGLRSTAAAALMGLSLVGCDKIAPETDYGVAESGYVDEDGDGYSADDGDCDDDNASVYPGAPEVDGDGVDSNCDGEDS